MEVVVTSGHEIQRQVATVDIKNLHDLSILTCHDSQTIRHLGSRRVFEALESLFSVADVAVQQRERVKAERGIPAGPSNKQAKSST